MTEKILRCVIKFKRIDLSLILKNDSKEELGIIIMFMYFMIKIMKTSTKRIVYH